MKLKAIILSGMAALLISGIFSTVVTAAPNDHHRDDRHRDDRKKHPDKYRLDNRYRHNQYYPRRGYEVNRVPPRRLHIPYRNKDYYFDGGIWYSPLDGRFTIVAPPLGIVVPTLPALYTTLWIRGIPYYYADDVYYLWSPARHGYVVTEAPADAEDEPVSVLADELYIYPKEGQSEQLQADDRYACHSWGADQSNYDPSQPPTGLSSSELNNSREAYQRAMRACLEGRGYSVR